MLVLMLEINCIKFGGGASYINNLGFVCFLVLFVPVLPFIGVDNLIQSLFGGKFTELDDYQYSCGLTGLYLNVWLLFLKILCIFPLT